MNELRTSWTRCHLLVAVMLVAACRCDAERIVRACVPEVCDGLDNDCDGTVDEDLGDVTCGVGACARSVPACVAAQPGTCVPGEPSAEVCNGIDDDCNGEVDDGLGVLACGVGACAREVASCDRGENATCVPGEPGVEVCNGIDDDCDGAVDEDLFTTPCGVGACQRRVNLCDPSAVCEPGTPTDELCNGRDDDCDGAVDEEVCQPPTVACSGPQLVRVGDVVSVLGTVLTAEGTTMDRWTIVAAPSGSIAAADPPDQLAASFVPDVAGAYELRFCSLDAAGNETCCSTDVLASDCESPPAPPVGTACDTSWDGRPIVTFPTVAADLHHDLVDASGVILATASAGSNWVRPSARIAVGMPPPGAPTTLGVRACRNDDVACCSATTSIVVNVVEACTTATVATSANVILSEYVVDGEGSCSVPDCFVCEAGEAVEITNLSNCPVSLDGTHFKYRNESASTGSLRWMNFGPGDVIPPRGVYVAIRGRNFAPLCSASFPMESSGLYGLAISTLVMQGNNTCSGWFNNTGGGMSEMQLAAGTVMAQADLDFATSIVLSRIAPYESGAGTCIGTGFDALDSCGNVTGGSMPTATLDPNQLGRLWHPCDAVPNATPACVRD